MVQSNAAEELVDTVKIYKAMVRSVAPEIGQQYNPKGSSMDSIRTQALDPDSRQRSVDTTPLSRLRRDDLSHQYYYPLSLACCHTLSVRGCRGLGSVIDAERWAVSWQSPIIFEGGLSVASMIIYFVDYRPICPRNHVLPTDLRAGTLHEELLFKNCNKG